MDRMAAMEAFGAFFALDNACSHEEGPLAEGEIEGHEVMCPWHGARFDVRTGEVLGPPAYEDLRRCAVQLPVRAWIARASLPALGRISLCNDCSL